MKIKYLVVGLLAISSGASADIRNVDFYGTINLSLDSVSAVGASSGENYSHRIRFTDNNSSFGVRGSEELIGSTKAIFQLELDVRPSAGLLAGLKNSAVGLQGDWGTLQAGKWDTPFRTTLGFMDPFYYAGVGAMHSIILTAGGGINETSTFNMRKDQILQYWTPKFEGFSAKFAYSPKEAAAASSKYLASGGINYANEALNVGACYERHRDFVSAGQEDTGLLAGVGYRFFDSLSLNLGWSQLKYAGAGQERKRTSILLTMIQRWEQFALRAAYGRAGGFVNSITGDEPESGATEIVAGGSYSLNRRTDVYAVYAKITNQANAFYNFGAGGYIGSSSSTPMGRGSDPTSIGVGIRHTF